MSDRLVPTSPPQASAGPIRDFRRGDIDAVAAFEAEIAIRSFAGEAVTDLEHYRKKLGKLLRYPAGEWTKVMEAANGSIAGWAWVSRRQNFITGDIYADFRSLYVDGVRAGPAGAVRLFGAVLAHCEASGFTRIVGRTASSNAAMRALYGLGGFEERHIVYELDIGPKGKVRRALS